MTHDILFHSRRVIFWGVLCAVAAFPFAGCGGGPKKATSTAERNPVEAGQPNAKLAARGDVPSPYRSGGEELPPHSRVVVRDVRDWDLPETAARSLGRIGSAAVPELTKQLTDRDPEVRERAANVLARIGPAAKQAVPDLVAALDDDDQAVRKSAALALGQIGPAAADAVPALTRVMKEKEDVAKAPEGKPQR